MYRPAGDHMTPGRGQVAPDGPHANARRPSWNARRRRGIQPNMRWLWCVAAASTLLGQQDPREIVRRSVETDQSNWRRALNYTFLERVQSHEAQAGGSLRQSSKTFDVTLLEGSPYRRLVARNDQPLPADEEGREQEKLEKSIAERRKETPVQRTKRLEEHQKRRDRNRAFVREIPDAFDFRLLNQEPVSGRNAWMIEASPKPGFRPRDSRAKLLTRMRGRLWIDQADYQWVRVEAEVIDTISFGWFVARLAKGSRLELDQNRVNEEVWLPRRVRVIADARVALVKHVQIDQEITYRNYRKFQADSQVKAIGEVQ